MEVARLVDQLGELVERRRRVGVRPERGDGLVLRDRVRRQQLRPRPLLRPELAQPQLPAVLEADEDARRLVSQRRARVEQLQPPGRHQVDEEHEVAGLDGQHLADPPDAVELPAREGVERRVERLQRTSPGASADSTPHRRAPPTGGVR